jgi:hypothetical protein
MSASEASSIVPDPQVTLVAAAELAEVELVKVLGWAGHGTITVEQIGDMDVVRLEEVRGVAARERSAKRNTLRDRLRGASPVVSVDDLDIEGLQRLARERG